MALVPAKCTQCGANLQIENTQAAAVCPHCNTPFVTETAINNYNTYNQTNLNFANADVHINSNAGKTPEELLSDADTILFQTGFYKKAESLYRTVTEKAPSNYRGWWGLARCFLFDTNEANVSEERVGLAYNLISAAINVAPAEVRNKLTEAWNSYYNTVQQTRQKLNITQQNFDTYNKKYEEKHSNNKLGAAMISPGIIIIIISIFLSLITTHLSPLLFIGIIVLGVGCYLTQTAAKKMTDTYQTLGEHYQQKQQVIKTLVNIDHQFASRNF